MDAVDDDGERQTYEAVDEQTPHWELEQVELAWELDQAIDALPAIYRESFVLKHIEGLGYDEMSEILGVNRDALKMRVYKARTLLCRSLGHLVATR
jgi:RNA polymerase sigma-70 factor (ECF subfamily)